MSESVSHWLETLYQGIVGLSVASLRSLDQFRYNSHSLSLFKKRTFY